MRTQSLFLGACILRALVQSRLWTLAKSLSLDPKIENDGVFTRRELLTWPLGIAGAVVYGKLVSDAAQKLSRGELVYPEAHERRVAATIATAMQSSIPLQRQMTRPLRVLEVGIGKECRVIRRNLYNEAYKEVASVVPKIEWFGVDIAALPESVKEQSLRKIRELDQENRVQTALTFIEGSISQPLDFSTGYFDCIISSLALCSVDDQIKALQEIRRLLRADGGSFGYMEHTAVLPEEPYRLLELQQELFDPLQQAVANNCHLHRYTDSVIREIFDSDGRVVCSERFIVAGMWPVSCQACGVVQKIQA